ncbi:MAG: epimerase [Acidobacteria bacterium]|nr:MAG: epimerase [Acidobacteriota bacterium]
MPDTILITGGAGFIGRRLARRALAAGWHVRILDALVAQVHGANPVLPGWISAECDLRLADVRDADAVKQAAHSADLVVHLAAETGTGQSMYAMHRYTDVNVSGTARVFEALQRESRCRRVIVASSRAVYGEGRYTCANCGPVFPPSREPERLSRGEWDPPCPSCGGPIQSVPTDESSRTAPVSVYGTTKLSQELLAFNFSVATGVPVFALRFQNVYGAGQSLSNPYTGILTHFFNAVRRGDAPRVFEDGQESRDFVHVDDVTSAVVRAFDAPLSGFDVVNVGAGTRTIIKELADLIVTVAGRSEPPVIVGDYRVGDVRHSVADLHHAALALGYRPEVPLASGVREFLEWAGAEPVSGASEQSANRELAAMNLLRSAHDH